MAKSMRRSSKWRKASRFLYVNEWRSRRAHSRDTKANVRLRTQNGAVLTDFDEKALITKTEAATAGS